MHLHVVPKTSSIRKGEFKRLEEKLWEISDGDMPWVFHCRPPAEGSRQTDSDLLSYLNVGSSSKKVLMIMNDFNDDI